MVWSLNGLIGFCVGVLFVLLCLVGVGVIVMPDFNEKFGLSFYGEDLSLPSCSGDVSDRVGCLNRVVKDNFLFNGSRVDGVVLSDFELFSGGGDCSDWTFFYDKSFRSWGLSTKSVVFDTGGVFSHVGLLVWDVSGYCWVDQLDYKCFSWS